MTRLLHWLLGAWLAAGLLVLAYGAYVCIVLITYVPERKGRG